MLYADKATLRLYPSNDGGGGIGERLRSAGPLRPKRRDFCRPAAGGVTEVKCTRRSRSRSGTAHAPSPDVRCGPPGLSLTRKSAALRHPWLRWPPTPAPGARAAPPRTSIRKAGDKRCTPTGNVPCDASVGHASTGCGGRRGGRPQNQQGSSILLLRAIRSPPPATETLRHQQIFLGPAAAQTSELAQSSFGG